MIKIQDNYLPGKTKKKLYDFIDSNEFQLIKLGEKEFSYIETPSFMFPFLEEKDHDLILSFIRRAYKGFDNDLRIHADNIINGFKTSKAKVLYLTGNEVGLNGTCFYSHNIHGRILPKDVSNEEFDRILTEDSNDESKWTSIDFVQAKKNRLLTYNSNYFHSKYPKEIEQGQRIVLVAFYKEKDQ